MASARAFRLILAARSQPPPLAHALTEALALLVGHRRPAALLDATAHVGAGGRANAEAAEQDPAEGQQAERLPEPDPRKCEEIGQEHIPQSHDDRAPERDEP